MKLCGQSFRSPGGNEGIEVCGGGDLRPGGNLSGGPLPANQGWEQVDLATLWNWREEGATVNGAVDRNGDAAVENGPQLRIKFAQPCQQVTDGRALDLELRGTTSL